MPARSSSLARLLDEPVFVTRQRCTYCFGDGEVPTPEMAAWSAAVDRHEQNMRAVAGSASTGEAETAVAPRPDQSHAKCAGCEGKGFCEREISVSELEQLLCRSSEGRRGKGKS
jgi:hypothetical protein